MGAPGVLIKPLQDEFGWCTSSIWSALAVRLVFFGMMGPFAVAFLNNFGVRRVVAFALTLVAIGFIGSLFMTKLWHLLVLWGLIIGFGTGSNCSRAWGDHLEPVVHETPGTGYRDAVREFRDRSACVPAHNGCAKRANPETRPT